MDSLSQFLTNTLAVTPDNATCPSTSTPAAGPSSLPISTTLLSLLFSFSALRDWLKLFFIGGLLDSCRRLAYAVYYKFINHFYITAEFHEGDNCYGPFPIILLFLHFILSSTRLDHGLALQAEDLGYGIPSYPSPILIMIRSGGEGAPSQLQIVWLV